MAPNSTERRKVSCVFHCQLVWYLTATRSFSIPTRKCKAPSGRSSRCSSKRTAPTLWFNASTNSASLSASLVRRCVGWQTHLGSVDPFTGDRRSGESILRRHLRVWSVSILQEDRPHRRDLYSIAPDATGSVACCYSGPPSGLHHLGSIPRQSQSPRSEPDQQRGSRWTCSRGTLLAARRVALWHLRAAPEYTLYRQWRSLPEL